MSTIRYLKRNEIDEQAWNKLVSASHQSLPYAYTWYLDAVAEHWDALVEGDYNSVMPLAWLRKLGLKCVYQPYYCQQLGIFSQHGLQAAEAKNFIETAIKNFPFIDTNLNPLAVVIEKKYHFRHKTNLLLSLKPDYSALKKSFSANHKRNIGKAEKAGVQFCSDIELKDFQKFYVRNVDRKKENFKTKHEKIFTAISETLVKKKLGEVLGITGTSGELLAATLLIHHQNRIIGIINTSSTEGKQLGASHYMFDRVIHQYAGTAKMLDFEGSSIPGIARFYEGFGAYPETFYNLRYNLLKKR